MTRTTVNKSLGSWLTGGIRNMTNMAGNALRPLGSALNSLGSGVQFLANDPVLGSIANAAGSSLGNYMGYPVPLGSITTIGNKVGKAMQEYGQAAHRVDKAFVNPGNVASSGKQGFGSGKPIAPSSNKPPGFGKAKSVAPVAPPSNARGFGVRGNKRSS